MNPTINKKTLNFINYASLPILVILVWYIATANGWVSMLILPNIKSVWGAFITLLNNGQLAGDLKASLSRVGKGYAIAVVFGISLGSLMGAFTRVNKFFILTLNFIRQIPILAWMPLIIIWFGIEETSKVVVVTMGTFFPILLNTISGIHSISPNYVEVGRMLKLNPMQMFLKVYIPQALPSIFVGLRLSMGIAWMVVVAAELIAAKSGLGFRINDARTMMQSDIVIVGMFVIGIVGITLDRIIGAIGRLITPWMNRR
ncbi:ABC transporter permease [Clostridia bacterium]|nr:ABC transporter permease [Clostridia bacterium]